MEPIPIVFFVLGAVALYALVFLVVLGKVAGRESTEFPVLSKITKRSGYHDDLDEPIAPRRQKIVVFDPSQEEEESDAQQDQKVS